MHAGSIRPINNKELLSLVYYYIDDYFREQHRARQRSGRTVINIELIVQVEIRSL